MRCFGLKAIHVGMAFAQIHASRTSYDVLDSNRGRDRGDLFPVFQLV